MYEDLSDEERLLLMKFLCAFAWSDLDISDKERAFVERMNNKLALDAAGQAQVSSWLDIAPSPHSLHPEAIPQAHRALFVDAARAMIYTDGNVEDAERKLFEKLRVELLGK
jgi:uncharacterized tellurite resistance protein B-like protein